MKKITPKIRVVLVVTAASLVTLGCATAPSVAELNTLTQQIVKASTLINTDETNKVCSEADALGIPLNEKTAKLIEEINMKAIKWPSDGKFIGDWNEGEKIAQNGRGLTFTDTATAVNGGNCYNCHKIDEKEISYGSIGPSLHNYGKIRGVTDPSSAASKPIVEYTWGKIWNAKAYNACSNMPRAGHTGILTEAQVRHVVGLLLDPNSPVNK